MYIYIYIYIYMGASHILSLKLATLGFMLVQSSGRYRDHLG